MPYRTGLGDAAPVVNRLTELSNDVLSLRALIDRRFSEVERLYKVDIALRAGTIAPKEAVRLLARPDPEVVSEVVLEVAVERLASVSP